MGAAIDTLIVSLERMTCCNCHVVFSIPREMVDRRRKDGKLFWCPNGHEQLFLETEFQKLEKKLEREKTRREWAESSRDEAYKREDRTKRKLAATKGVVTKQKNRASAGLCPCCKRSFEDLKRHMHSKHPKYGGGRDV